MGKWYEKVQEEFECFSCYELPLEPLTLPCAHNKVPNCSKAMLVLKFKKLVATNVQPKFQQLIFGGKIFNDKNDLCDYKIEDGYKIMLLKREPFGELSNSQSPKKKIVKEEKEEGKVNVKTEVKEEAMDEIMDEIKQEKNEDVKEEAKEVSILLKSYYYSVNKKKYDMTF